MKEFSNIEAVILDKDGVFVNFHQVWLRIIAYRAQLIAEKSAETSDALQKIRTACIRSMGVDEDDESIDPFGPCSMPQASVRLALATALYIEQNEMDPNYKWSTAFDVVDEAMEETKNTLSVVELSESFPGVLDKINDLKATGLKLAVYTSDTTENTKATLEKFKINDGIKHIQGGKVKTKELYIDLCNRLEVKPENTIMITDSPHDLRICKEAGAGAIVVLTGITDPDAILEYVEENADAILNSLADLELDQIQGKVTA